jgi:hypothetical protein
MQKSLISLITVIMFLGVISSAQSQEISTKGPCKADMEKICKDIRPGGYRIINCLKQHQSELSANCQTYFKK